MPFTTENGHKRGITFVNGNVSIPIMSIRLWAKDGQRSRFGDGEGETVHLPTGETDPILGRQGVYFMRVRVSNDILQPPDEPEDFPRRGMRQVVFAAAMTVCSL